MIIEIGQEYKLTKTDVEIQVIEIVGSQVRFWKYYPDNRRIVGRMTLVEFVEYLSANEAELVEE